MYTAYTAVYVLVFLYTRIYNVLCAEVAGPWRHIMIVYLNALSYEKRIFIMGGHTLFDFFNLIKNNWYILLV